MSSRHRAIRTSGSAELHAHQIDLPASVVCCLRVPLRPRAAAQHLGSWFAFNPQDVARSSSQKRDLHARRNSVDATNLCSTARLREVDQLHDEAKRLYDAAEHLGRNRGADPALVDGRLECEGRHGADAGHRHHPAHIGVLARGIEHAGRDNLQLASRSRHARRSADRARGRASRCRHAARRRRGMKPRPLVGPVITPKLERAPCPAHRGRGLCPGPSRAAVAATRHLGIGDAGG